MTRRFPLHFVPLFALTLMPGLAAAQSVLDNLPPAIAQSESVAPEAAPVPSAAKPTPGSLIPAGTATPAAPAAPVADPATVTDVSVDITADSAAHARDQAVMQAQRDAYAQLCTRLGAPAELTKIDDATLATMVKSFDIQSERLSSVRYLGVFTVHFKPAVLQKKLGKYAPTAVGSASGAAFGAMGEADKAALAATAAHLPVAIETPSLAAFAQTRRRLNELPQVVGVNTTSLGRGVSHVDLAYTGSLSDLVAALSAHGMVLREAASGEWDLTDSGAQ